MKKKTVITTEKREVWVIRQEPGEASSGTATENDEGDTEWMRNSIGMPNDELGEAHSLDNEEN